mgnify:CR=1 FL=1
MSDTIKQQWDEAVKSWIVFVRSGKDYHREYLNGPALVRMVGSVERRKVFDIACGEGYFARLFAKSGAEVTAIDISEAMIEEGGREKPFRNQIPCR